MMIDLGPHWDFIVWAYAGAFLAVATLVGWIVLDARRVDARLKALEAQGVRRRSSGPSA
jgi:heme exporter protein D